VVYEQAIVKFKIIKIDILPKVITCRNIGALLQTCCWQTARHSNPTLPPDLAVLQVPPRNNQNCF
jgi:hypothetical protein